MGPGVLAKYDHELGSVEGVGLGDVDMDLVLTLVLGYVRSAALSFIEAAYAVERTGLTDHEWWAAMAPTLERVFDAEQFPLAARVGLAATERYAGAYDPELASRSDSNAYWTASRPSCSPAAEYLPAMSSAEYPPADAEQRR